MRALRKTSSHKQALNRLKEDEKYTSERVEKQITDRRGVAGIRDTGNRRGSKLVEQAQLGNLHEGQL